MPEASRHTVGLILFPRFQLLAYVLATETLRLANKVAGRHLFDWSTASSTIDPTAIPMAIQCSWVRGPQWM